MNETPDNTNEDGPRTCVCTNAQGEVVRRLAETCWHECDRTNWKSSER